MDRFAAAFALICATLLTASPASRHFRLFDNMSYRGKPDTTADGFTVSNILYESAIWPKGTPYGVLPERAAFEALVRAHAGAPGPLVLDIEKLPVKGPAAAAQAHEAILATLADWARAAVGGKLVGYYGTNTLTRVPTDAVPYARELARHVNAFFPPAYTYDDDQTLWATRAKAAVEEAHSFGPGKPVYLYLWPQYHDNTPKQFEYLSSAYWLFELRTAKEASDGLVIWGPSRFDWNDQTGWWAATLTIIHSLEHGNHGEVAR